MTQQDPNNLQAPDELAVLRNYFRGDQDDGISAPDLNQRATFAEHIVHARGKRTQFTSVSLDQNAIRDFGEVVYQLRRNEAERDRHQIVEHERLLADLRQAAESTDKGDRVRALQAIRYVRSRRAGRVSTSQE